MTARALVAALVIISSIPLLSADRDTSPSPSPTEQRTYLTGGEVKALGIAFTTFVTSQETGGGSVPLPDLLVSIRHLSDGYHIEFECYPNQSTSRTYLYLVDASNFSIRLTSKGTEIFHS